MNHSNLRIKVAQLALKLGKFKVADLLLKLAMPVSFDANDPNEIDEFRVVYRIQNDKGFGP